MTPPRVLHRYVASMAFNFSAVPERAPLPQEESPGGRGSASHSLLRFFSHINYPAAS
jgi:hypothetical protein